MSVQAEGEEDMDEGEEQLWSSTARERRPSHDRVESVGRCVGGERELLETVRVEDTRFRLLLKEGGEGRGVITSSGEGHRGGGDSGRKNEDVDMILAG